MENKNILDIFAKSKTQQIKGKYNFYKNYGGYHSLCECYDKPSWNKIEAWEYCKRLCNVCNGKGLKILGYNTCTFSVGFTFIYEDKKYFAYITKDYNRVMEITE